MPHVVFQQVSKAFRAPDGQAIQALKDLSLEVNEGELLTLVGPSGCGKTTTLRLLAGLEKPDAGSLRIGGKNAADLPPEQRGVAMVFQTLALFPHFTVRENLAAGLRWRKLGRPEIAARVEKVAAQFELAGCLDRLPETLSGGQRQRVALARALILEPAVLLLDEPLSNVDAPLRAELRRELTALNHRTGVTMIHVTHDQAEAMALGHRIAIMRNGSLEQLGTPADVYHRPASRFVAEFFGTPRINFIPGTLVVAAGPPAFQPAVPNGTSAITLKLDGVPLPANVTSGQKLLLGVRPENLSGDGLPPEWQKMGDATVAHVERLGAETHLEADWHGHRLRVRTTDSEETRPGAQIGLKLRLRDAVLYSG